MTRNTVRGAEPATLRPDEHLPGLFMRYAEQAPDQVALSIPAGDGWADVTWRELAAQVRHTAAGLVARGVKPGDRVALMSATRMEWTVADLAILTAGAVTVPLYDTSSVGQCRQILSDSGAQAAFAATGELADRLQQAGDSPVVVLEDGGLEELGDDAEAPDHKEVDRRLSTLTLDDVATIVYTSGTTGDPKGCVLTHGNLAWTTRQARIHLDEVIGGGGRTLLFLPLAHIFARLIQFACLEAGLQIGFPGSPDDLRADMRSFRPTFLLGVPRVFEKVFEGARRQATGLRAPLFDFAVTSARDWASAERPGPWLRARRAVADRLVLRRLREAMGGQVEFVVSGGAPLSRDLGLFFHGARMSILEGYGLTETTAPVCVNSPSRLRIGTVGVPLPGVEVRIADDGEVLVRGGNVFRGYHGNEEATAEDFDGDWFRTGDLGTLDDDGFLTLHDRKKEIVVTASGKNVAPTPLEERMTAHDLVAQAMIVGDRRKFVAALVTLDDAELQAFAERRGLEGGPDELRRHELVRKEVQRAVDHANDAVSRAESIREFVILDREFTEDAGELTPTLKLRRHDIAQHFSQEIESIYGEGQARN